MAKTVVDICNMAIGRLGISQFLSSYTADQSNEAIVCRLFYDNARDRVLQELPWNFATRTAVLTDLGTPPTEWLYRYRYPADCLVARKVTAAGNSPITIGAEFQVIENEATGSGELAIVSNQPAGILIYTAQILKPTLYSQLFIDALAWSLAMDIAAPLSSSPQVAQLAAQAYQAALQRAIPRHFNEGKDTTSTKNSNNSEFIDARR